MAIPIGALERLQPGQQVGSGTQKDGRTEDKTYLVPAALKEAFLTQVIGVHQLAGTNLVADNYSINGFGAPEISPVGGGSFKEYLITVNYLPKKVTTQSNGKTVLYEKSIDFDVDLLTLPAKLRYATIDDQGNDEIPEGTIPLPIHKVIKSYKIYNATEVNESQLVSLIGKISNGSMFGCPEECVKLNGARATESVDSEGNTKYTIDLTFEMREVSYRKYYNPASGKWEYVYRDIAKNNRLEFPETADLNALLTQYGLE